MKNLVCLSLLFAFFFNLLCSYAQDMKFKQPMSENEIQYISEVFEYISITDQKYRSYLHHGTLDDKIIATVDSILDNVGIEEGMKYEQSLNLSLPKQVKDSLWKLQHQLDFQNHMTIRGIWDTYGYIPEELIKEKNYVQILLLMHPPKNWDIPTYHTEYAELLIQEVRAGRMPAKTYATFYDNILCKIMRKPQRYGTNQQYDPKQGKVLPPIIEDLATANEARQEIGMPLLSEGEYRLASEVDSL